MATLNLTRPELGAEVIIPVTSEHTELALEFPIDEALFEKVDDNLEIFFEDDETVLVLEDFYANYSSENMPSFLIDGAEISGEEFFAALDSSLMPAAGPAAPAVANDGMRFGAGSADSLAEGLDALGDTSGGSGYTRQSYDLQAGNNDGNLAPVADFPTNEPLVPPVPPVVDAADYNVSLVYDLSSSFTPDKIEAVTQSIENYLDSLKADIDAGAEIGLQVVRFATYSKVQTTVVLTSENYEEVVNEIMSEINGLYADPSSVDVGRNGTNYEAALNLITKWHKDTESTETQPIENVENKVVIFTDGEPIHTIASSVKLYHSGESIEIPADATTGSTWTVYVNGKECTALLTEYITSSGSAVPRLYVYEGTDTSGRAIDVCYSVVSGGTVSNYGFETTTKETMDALDALKEALGLDSSIEIAGFLDNDATAGEVAAFADILSRFGDAFVVKAEDVDSLFVNGEFNTDILTNSSGYGQASNNIIIGGLTQAQSDKFENLFGAQAEVDKWADLTLSPDFTYNSPDTNDVLIGFTGDDIIYGQHGNDIVIGDGDDSTLGKIADYLGLDANDYSYDSLSKSADVQADIFDLIEKMQELSGTAFDNFATWTESNLENADDGNDVLYGELMQDVVFGLGGNDELYGGQYADILLGGSGNDTIYGESGYDVMHGGSGDDVLIGGTGRDTMYGGDGDDTLQGGTDSDTMYGGEGNDTFLFESGDFSKGSIDTIKDFEAGDILDLSDFKSKGFSISAKETTTDGVIVELSLENIDGSSSTQHIIVENSGSAFNAEDLIDEINNSVNGQISI